MSTWCAVGAVFGAGVGAAVGETEEGVNGVDDAGAGGRAATSASPAWKLPVRGALRLPPLPCAPSAPAAAAAAAPGCSAFVVAVVDELLVEKTLAVRGFLPPASAPGRTDPAPSAWSSSSSSSSSRTDSVEMSIPAPPAAPLPLPLSQRLAAPSASRISSSSPVRAPGRGLAPPGGGGGGLPAPALLTVVAALPTLPSVLLAPPSPSVPLRAPPSAVRRRPL